jgi:futalosine hydrolase
VRILVVSATAAEIGPVTAELRPLTRSRSLGAGPSTRSRSLRAGREITTHFIEDKEVDVLVTGVGMVATATWCSRVLSHARYDAAFNLGVCGSFDPSLTPGTVVHVVSDRLAELGAEDGDAFLSIHQLQLLGENEPPFVNGWLVNQAPPVSATLDGLPAVSGITVNTVHGHEPSIAAVTERYAPHVESMEGAAFMYACLAFGQRFAQIRAVSNRVERRNRDAWKLPEAVASLGATTLRMLSEL